MSFRDDRRRSAIEAAFASGVTGTGDSTAVVVALPGLNETQMQAEVGIAATGRGCRKRACPGAAVFHVLEPRSAAQYPAIGLSERSERISSGSVTGPDAYGPYQSRHHWSTLPAISSRPQERWPLSDPRGAYRCRRSLCTRRCGRRLPRRCRCKNRWSCRHGRHTPIRLPWGS